MQRSLTQRYKPHASAEQTPALHCMLCYSRLIAYDAMPCSAKSYAPQNNQKYNVMVFNLQQQYQQNFQNVVMYGSTNYGGKSHPQACAMHLLL